MIPGADGASDILAAVDCSCLREGVLREAVDIARSETVNLTVVVFDDPADVSAIRGAVEEVAARVPAALDVTVRASSGVVIAALRQLIGQGGYGLVVIGQGRAQHDRFSPRVVNEAVHTLPIATLVVRDPGHSTLHRWPVVRGG